MKNRAFTLVELLVVIAILGVLSSMTAVMLSGAKREALETKTARQIDLIEQILLTRMSEMGFSPVPMVGAVNLSSGQRLLPAAVRDSSRVNLMARRDQFRMAFPDRRADLLHPPTQLRYLTTSAPSGTSVTAATKIQPPPSWGRMRTRMGLGRPSALPAINESVGAGQVYSGNAYAVWGLLNATDATTHVVPTSEPVSDSDPNLSRYWTIEHESAECLWLILSVTEFNGVPALDVIGNSFVGNNDNDLVPEIVDAWGEPLAFLRWPAGAQYADIQNSGPDAFDYLRTDYRYEDSLGAANTANDPINLTPMIVSSGVDREFGIRLTIGGPFSDESNVAVIRDFSYATVLYTGTSSATLPSAPYFYPDPFYNVVDYANDASRNDITLSRGRRGLGSPLPLDSTVDPDTGPVSEAIADNITNFGS